MANAYEAGAAGLPCAVFRGYIGVDLPKVNPNIRRITCPFTGEKLAAVPAHRPDVAIIHALRADRAGNVLLEGIVGVQKEAVLAAKRSIVTVEEIVDDFGPRNLNAVILPSWTVSAVVVVPGGAYPSYAQGYYKRDNAFYIDWDAISRDRDGFLAWMKANVLDRGPEVFAEHARRLNKAAQGIAMADYTPAEMMTIAAARALRNSDVCFVGIGLPSAAVQSGAADARAGHHADLRVRHDRNQARRAAALDRRRRVVRDRAHHGARCRRCSATGCRAAA